MPTAIVKVDDLQGDSPERGVSVQGPIERVHVAVLDIVSIVAKYTAAAKAKGLPVINVRGALPPETSTPAHLHSVPTHLAGIYVYLYVYRLHRYMHIHI